MKNYKFCSIILLLLIIFSCAGCISGGNDEGNTTTTPTEAPTTTTPAPTEPPTVTQQPTSTVPPTTVPPAPEFVHSECSTNSMNFDAGNTRYYMCNAPDNPTEVWKADTLMMQGYILTDYDRAYLFQSNYGDYEVKCYDVYTGENLWTITTPFMNFQNVFLKDERIYMFQFTDVDSLYCYDAKDGKFLWNSENIMDLYPGEKRFHLSSLNYSDGKILAVLVTLADDIIAGDGRCLCCFDSSNGEILWHKIFDQDSCSRPAIENGTAYFSTILLDQTYNYSTNDVEKIIGIDMDNGNQVYDISRDEHYFNQRQIIVSDGKIYAIGQKRDLFGQREEYNMYLFCFSAYSDDVLWTYKIVEKRWGNLTLGEDKIFISMQDYIICIDTTTHAELWRKQIEYYNEWNPPIYAGDKLIVFISQTGVTSQVMALDPETGQDLWTVDLEGLQIANAASFYKNLMLVGTDLGYLYCFE